MSRELVAHNKPVFNHLHPKIYGAAAGLIAWFALMAVSFGLTAIGIVFVIVRAFAT